MATSTTQPAGSKPGRRESNDSADTTSGTSSSSIEKTPKDQISPRSVKYRSISSSETRCADKVVIKAASDDDGDIILVKPKLRGKIHLVLLLLAPAWVALLLSACRSVSSIAAATVSCLSFIANFAASALLHCGNWGPEWRSLVVKLDHAGIFVVISSCTTPIPVLLLDFWPSFFLLTVQGLATLYGFWIILFGRLSSGARQKRAWTYIAIGLLHAVFLKSYCSVLTTKEFALVISLATLYIVGAIVYGNRWPDPFPTHFGFHELFHLCCCFSFVLTMWLNYEIITRTEATAGA